MPPLDPRVVRTLSDEAKRLRGQLTIWFSVVEGHHPVHLVYAWTKLERALTVLEVDLEWERQLTNSTWKKVAVKTREQLLFIYAMPDAVA
jgi:hypothetical protein